MQDLNLCQQENTLQNKIEMPLIIIKPNDTTKGIKKSYKKREWKGIEIKKIKTESLIGERFGKLIIIDFITKNGFKHLVCKCDCGNVKTIKKTSLLYGYTTSCGCHRKDTVSKRFSQNITGQKFNKLTILEIDYDNTSRNKRQEKRFICKCECGKIKNNIRKSDLKSGAIKSCGCIRKGLSPLPKGQSGLNSSFYKYQAGAKERNIEFHLNKEEFKEITQKNCFYCGSQPEQGNGETWKENAHGRYLHSGIDRVNNQIGYIKENCVPCCNKCNKAKFKFSKEEFITHIKKIYEFLKLK